MSNRNIAVIAIGAIVVIAAIAAVAMSSNGGDDKYIDPVGTYTVHEFSSVVMDGDGQTHWREISDSPVFEIVSVEDNIMWFNWDGSHGIGTIDPNGDVIFSKTYYIDGMECIDIGDGFYKDGVLTISVMTKSLLDYGIDGIASCTRAVFVKDGIEGTPADVPAIFEKGDVIRSFATYENNYGARLTEDVSYEMEVLETRGLVSIINVTEYHRYYTSYEYTMLAAQMEDTFAKAVSSYLYSTIVSDILMIDDTIAICNEDLEDSGEIISTTLATKDGKIHETAELPNISGNIYKGVKHQGIVSAEGTAADESFCAFGVSGEYTVDFYSPVGTMVASMIPSTNGYDLYFQSTDLSGLGLVKGYGLLSKDLKTLYVSTVGVDLDGNYFAAFEELELCAGEDDVVGVYYGTCEHYAYSDEGYVLDWNEDPTYSTLVITDVDGGLVKGFYHYLPFIGTYDGTTISFSSVYWMVGDVFVTVGNDGVFLNEHYIDDGYLYAANRGYVKIDKENTDGRGHIIADTTGPMKNSIPVGTVLESALSFSVVTTHEGYESYDVGSNMHLECVMSDKGLYLFDVHIDGEPDVPLLGFQKSRDIISLMGYEDGTLVTYTLTTEADCDAYMLSRTAEVSEGDKFYCSLAYAFILTESGEVVEIGDLKDISGDYVMELEAAYINDGTYLTKARTMDATITTVEGTHGRIVVINGVGDDPLVGLLRYVDDSHVLLTTSIHLLGENGSIFYADLFGIAGDDSFTLYGAGNGSNEEDSSGMVFHLTRA